MASSKKRKLTKLYRARINRSPDSGQLYVSFDTNEGVYSKTKRRWCDVNGWTFDTNWHKSQREAIETLKVNISAAIRSTSRHLGNLMQQYDVADKNLRELEDELP